MDSGSIPCSRYVGLPGLRGPTVPNPIQDAINRHKFKYLRNRLQADCVLLFLRTALLVSPGRREPASALRHPDRLDDPILLHFPKKRLHLAPRKRRPLPRRVEVEPPRISSAITISSSSGTSLPKQARKASAASFRLDEIGLPPAEANRFACASADSGLIARFRYPTRLRQGMDTTFKEGSNGSEEADGR